MYHVSRISVILATDFCRCPLEEHIFKFDFLNDSFNDLPDSLGKVIQDPEERRKLIVYINPPYGEAGEIRQLSGTGKNKKDIAVATKTYEKHKSDIGIAGRELFAQFLIRIYHDG